MKLVLKEFFERVIKDIFESIGLDLRRTKPSATGHFFQLQRIRDNAPSQADTAAGRFLNFLNGRFTLSNAQLFQDIFVDFVLRKSRGTFCEFGATDGLCLSNTCYLEKHLGWSGILAEPARQWHASLKENRPTAIIDTRCVYSSSGNNVKFIEAKIGEFSTMHGYSGGDPHTLKRRHGEAYEVETVTLNDLLVGHGVTSLDYLSADTEGSEAEIISSFDFDRFRPSVLTIEHNYTDARDTIHRLMLSKGYQRVFEEFSAFDDWYVSEESWNELLRRENLS